MKKQDREMLHEIAQRIREHTTTPADASFLDALAKVSDTPVQALDDEPPPGGDPPPQGPPGGTGQ